MPDHRADHADRHGYGGPDELDVRTLARGGTADGTKFLRDDGTWASAGGAYTAEDAQDAVGGILTDSSTIDFTYDDAGNTITAIVKASSLSASHLSFDVATQAELDAAVAAERTFAFFVG